MSTALHAALDRRSNRIRLSGGEGDEFLALVTSLAWPRKHAEDWEVDATPATIKRLADFGFVLDMGDPESPMLQTLAQWEWADQQIVRKDQPPRRVLDSWDHQLAMYHHAMPRHAFGQWVCMGGGKTKAFIDTVVNRNAKTVLVLCPLTVCSVWRGEIELHMPPGKKRVLILDRGSVVQKANLLNTALRYPTDGILWVVCNYDSAKVGALAAVILAHRWGGAVCDESHRIKDARTVVGKFCLKLAAKADHRECLSGTPIPNGLLDIFGQAAFIDKGLFGSSFTSFKDRYSLPHYCIRGKIRGYINQEEFIARLAMLSIRIEADVLDLPEAVHQKIPVVLTPDVRSKYEVFKKQAIVEIEQGLVTAANAPVKLLRLQQVTSGHWKTEDERVVPTDTNPKLDRLEELLGDIDHSEPVVVFCRFKYDLLAIEKLAAKLGLSYAEVSGRKKELNPDGTLPEGVKVMGVQIQSGGLGVNLTRSAICVFYSLGYALADYLQALARLVRPGQKRNVRFIHLVAEDTVDEQVYEALDHKANVVEMVMTALRKEQHERSIQAVRQTQVSA
jgi:SNF2 family DNA or RNA helicase